MFVFVLFLLANNSSQARRREIASIPKLCLSKTKKQLACTTGGLKSAPSARVGGRAEEPQIMIGEGSRLEPKWRHINVICVSAGEARPPLQPGSNQAGEVTDIRTGRSSHFGILYQAPGCNLRGA